MHLFYFEKTNKIMTLYYLNEPFVCVFSSDTDLNITC